MKIYKGNANPDQYEVTVNGKPLPLRLDLRNHSPTGFSWGYGGSGPAQLSLAILADYLGSDSAALSLYHGFKHLIIGLQDDDGQPLKEWELSGDQVEQGIGTATRKLSPTWPIVGTFAMEMERQLRLHADRGDRPGWMAVAPVELIQAVLEQATMASDILMGPIRLGMSVPENKRQELLRRCAHIANFAMMTADSCGLLPEATGNRMLTATEAAARQSILLSEIERFRATIGAQQEESTEDALLRYTGAIRSGEVMPADALSRWKDEQRGHILASVENVVRAWWSKWMSSDRADILDVLLNDTHAINVSINDTPESEADILNRRELSADTHDAGPEAVQDEQPRPDGDDPDGHQPMDGYEAGIRTPVDDSGRAPGCLDPSCGDCDMK